MNDSLMYADVQTPDGIKHFTFSNSGGIELEGKRSSPRNTGCPEKEVERQLIQKMNESNFKENESDAFKWLQTLFGNEKITKENLRAIAGLAAFLINEHVPREYYRRRKTNVLWIQERFEKITRAFSDFPTTFTYKGKAIKITPPFSVKSQPSALPSVQRVAQIEFQEFDEKYSFEDLFDNQLAINEICDTDQNDIFNDFDSIF